MNNKFALFLGVLLLGSASMAQNISATKMPSADYEPRRVRIGVLAPLLDASFKVSNEGQSKTSSESIQDSLGISAGYANLPLQELGWTANGSYMRIANGGPSFGLARVDGNLAYAFSEVMNVKGGLNLSKFISGGDLPKLDASLGVQLCLGFQMTKSFGLDIGYTQMNQSGKFDDFNLELKESGLELGLYGTF